MQNNLKSAEQRLLEKATEEYRQKLNSIFNKEITVEVSIEGATLTKIATITEFLRDEEGIKKEIHSFNGCHAVRSDIKGEGYLIAYISE